MVHIKRARFHNNGQLYNSGMINCAFMKTPLEKQRQTDRQTDYSANPFWRFCQAPLVLCTPSLYSRFQLSVNTSTTIRAEFSPDKHVHLDLTFKLESTAFPPLDSIVVLLYLTRAPLERNRSSHEPEGLDLDSCHQRV